MIISGAFQRRLAILYVLVRHVSVLANQHERGSRACSHGLDTVLLSVMSWVWTNEICCLHCSDHPMLKYRMLAEDDNMIAVNVAVGPRIMLQSGAWFDFLDPESSEFKIEDIAAGLSNTCRYAGQCSAFFSVAEHSLLVSEVANDHEYAALMHDAAEAFVGDITRPLKQLLPDFKQIEARVEKAIFDRFGVERPIPKEVKAADLRVLAAEQAQIMPRETSLWAFSDGVEPAPITVRCLTPTEANEAFLARYYSLASQAPAMAHSRVA